METYICRKCNKKQYTSNPYSTDNCIYCGSNKVEKEERNHGSNRRETTRTDGRK